LSWCAVSYDAAFLHICAAPNKALKTDAPKSARGLALTLDTKKERFRWNGMSE